MARGSVVAVLGSCAGVLLLAGCGQEQPVGDSSGFGGPDAGTNRVLGVYRQDATSLTRSVTLPAGTQQVRVRVDCIGSGLVEVRVFRGTAGLPCSDTSGGNGWVGISQDTGLRRAAREQVRITAPRGSSWSVVVDAGPGRAG